MSITVLDPSEVRMIRGRLPAGAGRFEECWNGRIVVPPLPNMLHQQLQFLLCAPIHELVVRPGLGTAYAGCNVSDRADGWDKNYRGPDVAVYLAANTAVAHENHMEGGPDFLVEIISPGEGPRAKFKFYAKIGTREVLLILRDPWALELHQLQAGKFQLSGRSDLDTPTVLASGVLPLTFQLVPGAGRPQIQVSHPTDGRTWPV